MPTATETITSKPSPASGSPAPTASRSRSAGGGHSAAGLGVGDGALVIDLSLLRSTTVNPQDHIVRVEAGCTWGDVDHATSRSDA